VFEDVEHKTRKLETEHQKQGLYLPEELIFALVHGVHPLHLLHAHSQLARIRLLVALVSEQWQFHLGNWNKTLI